MEVLTYEEVKRFPEADCQKPYPRLPPSLEVRPTLFVGNFVTRAAGQTILEGLAKTVTVCPDEVKQGDEERSRPKYS